MTLEHLVNLLLLAQTCFLLGITAVVLARYYGRAARQHPRLFQHIGSVAVSYCIFQLRGIWAIYAGLIPLDDPWLYALLVGVGLGDYALLKVARRQAYPRNPNGSIHATTEGRS